MSTAPAPALARFLHAIPLFSLVDLAHAQDLLRLLQPVELAAGEVLFREGEPGRALWVLEEGTEVTVQARIGPGDAPVTVATLGPGEVVGEMALVDEGERSATATVTRPGRAQRVDALEFHALRDMGHPTAFQVLRRLCMDLCRRLRATSDRIQAPAPGEAPGTQLPAGPAPTPEELDLFPALRPLPQVVKLALASRLAWVEGPPGVPLFAEGERGDAAYLLVGGEVAVARRGHTLERVRAGQMLGLLAVIDWGPRAATCTPTAPSRLLRLSARDFDALFVRDNRFAFHIVDHVARQLVAHLRRANRLLSPWEGEQAAPALSRSLESLPLELELGFDETAALARWGG